MGLFRKTEWIPELDLTDRKDLLKYWINPYNKKSKTQNSITLESDKDLFMDIVGESFNTKTFEKMYGKRTREGHHEKTLAVLIPEPYNEHDEYAVAVYVEKGIVGHLSRYDAYDIQELLIRTMHQTQCLISIKARVKGGWKKGFFDKGSFGLELCIAKYELISDLTDIKNDPEEWYKN